MSWFWKPYVSVAKRRANAAKEARKLATNGKTCLPVVLEGKKIASSFWGKAWCDNLESYSDYSNRLPRGRTYVRNGSVLDLQIAQGEITALVSGSSIYRISIKIKPLGSSSWKKVLDECSGKIDSLIELLQGKLSSGVMQVVTDRERGLFPKPAEITMKCSCPDWAGLCKHLAACLYGIGARLDKQPDLLFTLRGVNPGELVSAATAAKAVETGAPAQGSIADSEIADIFGIEIDPASQPQALPSPPSPSAASPAAPPPAKRRTKTAAIASAKADRAPRKLTASARERIAEAARRRWAAMKEAAKAEAVLPAARVRKRKPA